MLIPVDEHQGPQLNLMPAAGIDPAYIPGITPPPGAVRAAARDGAADGAGDQAAEADALAPAAGEDSAPARDAEKAAVEDEPAADGGEQPEDETEAEAATEDQDPGPVFEASDLRASVRVGRAGVRLTLDAETAEFDWAEIGAVEYTTGRLRPRLTVVVHTVQGHRFPADLTPPSRRVQGEWTAALDAALDAFFEEDDADSEEVTLVDGAPSERSAEPSEAAGRAEPAAEADSDAGREKDTAEA